MSDKPVAWLYIDPNNPHLNVHYDEVDVSQFPHDEWFPVYTHPQPKQEQDKPVAYLCENAVGHKYFRWKKPSSTYKPIPLYTQPQNRTWVNLTHDEHNKLAVDWGCLSADWILYAAAVERAVKEKNNG